MNSNKPIDLLQIALQQEGFKSAVVSSQHVPELRREIKMKLETGQIKEQVYREYSNSFDNMLNQDYSWAESIIVVAIPQPILEVDFLIDGKKRSTIIPPTYDRTDDKKVTGIIENFLTPRGYRLERAFLPQKLLAVRSGLARYGKNNITYIKGLGSFHRPIIFYSDIPCINDYWQEPRALDECTDCKACINKCPTGAIDPDRFQIHAERCLTFHNEADSSFPAWINPSSHHCLIGCMKCQFNCPVNKDVRHWRQKFAEFDTEESRTLLEGVPLSKIPANIRTKFGETSLLENPANFARNLKSALQVEHIEI